MVSRRQPDRVLARHAGGHLRHERRWLECTRAPRRSDRGDGTRVVSGRRWIAYTRRPPGSQYEGALGHAIRTAPIGIRLTTLGASSLNPTWSTDSKPACVRFGVVATRSSTSMCSRCGQKNARRLTREGPDTFEPSWSPDGHVDRVRAGRLDPHGRLEPENVDELTVASDNDSSPALEPVRLRPTSSAQNVPYRS